MYSNGHTRTGSADQERFRACCIYAGCHGAHREAVLSEALPVIATLPPDAVTLEAVVTADSLRLLDELDRVHGDAPWNCLEIEKDSFFLRLRHIAPGPACLARIGQRLLAARRSDLAPPTMLHLAIRAAVETLPSLFREIVADEALTDSVLIDLLRDSRVMSGPVLAGSADILAPRLAALATNPGTRKVLTEARSDDSDPKGLAILVRAGLAVPLAESEIAHWATEAVRRMLLMITSAHGRLALLRILPDLETLIATAPSAIEAMVCAGPDPAGMPHSGTQPGTPARSL